MSGVGLRTAVPADDGAVVDLIQALNRFEQAISGDRLAEREPAERYFHELMDKLARSGGRLVVAEADDGVIGAMGFAINVEAAYVHPDLRRCGHVTDLIVHEDWRGRGVGRLLLQEAERLTREAGLKRLSLGVLTGNDGALAAYRRFGLRPYAQILVKDLG